MTALEFFNYLKESADFFSKPNEPIGLELYNGIIERRNVSQKNKYEETNNEVIDFVTNYNFQNLDIFTLSFVSPHNRILMDDAYHFGWYEAFPLIINFSTNGSIDMVDWGDTSHIIYKCEKNQSSFLKTLTTMDKLSATYLFLESKSGFYEQSQKLIRETNEQYHTFIKEFLGV